MNVHNYNNNKYYISDKTKSLDIFSNELNLDKCQNSVNVKLGLVDEQIIADIKNGFPGAVLLVYKDNQIIKRTSYGYKLRYNQNGGELLNKQCMKSDALFDLASNTKMYATNYALMHLVYLGVIDINKPIKYYLSEYTIPGGESRIVKDLLCHNAGYMPSNPFYNKEQVEKYASELYSQERESTINIMLAKLPFLQERSLKPIYSDNDFILLGILIEKVTNKRLDDYLQKTIYLPLGLMKTMFNPFLFSNDCAATELNGNTRDGIVNFSNIRLHTLQGEVHDEVSYYCMNGVSGHAGLFSSADDLLILLKLMLNYGRYNDLTFWDKKTQDDFTAPNFYDDSYGLGWRRSGKSKYFAFGDYASEDTVGHVGFTGTLTLIDKQNNLIIILLTNKIHTKFENGNFLGNSYETGRYKKIVNLIYEACII